eukprot:2762399-Amphidinium_carterae.1
MMDRRPEIRASSGTKRSRHATWRKMCSPQSSAAFNLPFVGMLALAHHPATVIVQVCRKNRKTRPIQSQNLRSR